MQLRRYRWSKHYESAEEELVDFLADKKMQAERWVAEEYQEFSPKISDKDTRLFCVEGSMAININGKEFSLQTGDALDIPAETSYQSKAGFSGCVCYESKTA